jgi:hypothetical protein
MASLPTTAQLTSYLKDPPSAAGDLANELGKLDEFGYICIACLGGIFFSGTKAAPIIFGLNGIALIYQLDKLLQPGKSTTANQATQTGGTTA